MPGHGTPRGTLSQRELSVVIARYLGTVEVGARLPTVRELAERSGASIGAVQGVLSRLAASGGVVLHARPGIGTILEMRSIPRLWAEAHPRPMVLALRPPGTPRLQGLATAIKSALTENGIETYLIFSRGSRRRVGALHRGACDAVVMSALGANDGACGPDETIAAVMPIRTYASRHRVYERPLAGVRRPLRVASDPDSADLQRLLAAEYEGKPVEFYPAAYLQHEQLLRSGTIDVMIWDEEEAPPLPPEIICRSLGPQVDELADAATRTVVVTRVDDVLTTKLLAECLTSEAIVDVQEAVLAGLRPPEY